MIEPLAGTPEYIPLRILNGGKPSVGNCFGCIDEITRATPRGTHTRVCGVSGKVVYKTPVCPKLAGRFKK